MKTYKTEMLKLLVIAFVTPILVMLYTTIEKAVVKVDKAEQTNMKPVSKPTEENEKKTMNDYILAKNK